MLYKEGKEFKAFAEEEIREHNVKHSRDFSGILKNDYLLRGNTRRGVLVTGLRSTGKSFGVYQAAVGFPSDRIFFIAPSSREEGLTKDSVLEMLKKKDYDLIFIDEYSWLKDTEGEEDHLAGYLAGKAGEGVKVIITGTDSTKIHELLNTDFIHRAVQLSTTYFSYDEYCRLYELEKNDGSLKDFLTRGGIFENHADETYGSMKRYIRTAIIGNLGAYYPQYDRELIEAAVYKIFYKCICKSYTKNAGQIPVYSQGKNRLAYEDFLENFGIRSDIEIRPALLKEIFHELHEIGVVVILDDIRQKGRTRAYITNQTISAQMTKCIYGLDELPESYLGNLFEASVACYEYMQHVFEKNSPFRMYYAETRKSDLEIDFILCDQRKAYLFECKLNDNDDMKLNDTASILQDSVENLLGDRELAGRYVIYQGREKCIRQQGHTVICTSDWDIGFEDFKKHVKRLSGADGRNSPSSGPEDPSAEGRDDI
jgi:predicted AAA+ superfamily ATPase